MSRYQMISSSIKCYDRQVLSLQLRVMYGISNPHPHKLIFQIFFAFLPRLTISSYKIGTGDQDSLHSVAPLTRRHRISNAVQTLLRSSPMFLQGMKFLSREKKITANRNRLLKRTSCVPFKVPGSSLVMMTASLMMTAMASFHFSGTQTQTTHPKNITAGLSSLRIYQMNFTATQITAVKRQDEKIMPQVKKRKLYHRKKALQDQHSY